MNFKDLTTEQLIEAIETNSKDNIVETMSTIIYSLEPQMSFVLMTDMMTRSMIYQKKTQKVFGDHFMYLNDAVANKMMFSMPSGIFVSSRLTTELGRQLFELARRIKEQSNDPKKKLFDEIVADESGLEAFKYAVSKIKIKNLSVTESMGLQMAVATIEGFLKRDKS